jgi:hypothetical protein
VKNYNREKAGEKILDWWLAEKRGCIFSARGIAKNVRERSSEEKRRKKRVNCKIKMPIILSKEVVLKHPCIPCAG